MIGFVQDQQRRAAVFLEDEFRDVHAVSLLRCSSRIYAFALAKSATANSPGGTSPVGP